MHIYRGVGGKNIMEPENTHESGEPAQDKHIAVQIEDMQITLKDTPSNRKTFNFYRHQ